MADPRTEFKIGFLQKAAQMGISPSQLEQLLEREKAAGWADWVPGAGLAQHFGKKVIDTGSEIASGIGKQVVPLTLLGTVALPLAGGALAGHLAARAQNIGEKETSQEEKQRELIDAYRQATKKLQLMQRTHHKRDKNNRRTSFGVL